MYIHSHHKLKLTSDKLKLQARRDNMKVKDLITKLQKLEKTTSGEVSFKICTRGGKKISHWEEGDILTEVDLHSCENADDVFTEIIFEKEQATS